jgi:two-component system sensor histidine kinase/response regulator
MAHILIVDDEEYQRLLIRDTLASEPVYEFVEAENGTQALEILQEQPVDLVLLDVMMPKLDGFEVCRILKADPKLRPTQVILVTALGQVEHKVRGLDSGADDFLNKPFEEAELQARVRSALRVKEAHDQLQHLLKLRNDLVQMIMHDMGTQITVVQAMLEMYDWVEPASPQAIECVRSAYSASLQLNEMIGAALDVGRLEDGRLPLRREHTDSIALVGSSLDFFRNMAQESNVTLDLQLGSETIPPIYIDATLIRRVVSNLLMNALKHVPENSTITTHLWVDKHTLLLSVTDQGTGIAPEDLPFIFDKYRQAEKYKDRRERPGRGLGLAFCKLAVEAHNGEIYVASVPDEGATFTISLPYL